MSINQITELRMPDGSQVAFVDWSDKPLYSSVDLLAGFTDQQIDLFQYTSGDAVAKSSNITTPRQATEADTNMATPGALASTEEMFIYSIQPEYIEQRVTGAGDATTAAVFFVNQPRPAIRRLAVLQAQLSLVLDVSQKWNYQASLATFNSGFGVFGGPLVSPGAFGNGSAPGATSIRTGADAGWPGQDAVRQLAVPVYIGGQEKWRVSLHNFTGAACNCGVLEAEPLAQDASIMHTIRIWLMGLYKRPTA